MNVFKNIKLRMNYSIHGLNKLVGELLATICELFFTNLALDNFDTVFLTTLQLYIFVWSNCQSSPLYIFI